MAATLLASAALIAVPSAVGTGTVAAAAAGSPCGATVNPVTCENRQPGSPPSEWDISGAGDDSIQGFSTDVSVNVGSTISFKINTTASAYTIALYRLGYYGGNGARRVGTVEPSAALPQSQPTCLSDPSTLLVDCGNWAVSASWNVPATAVSGIYLAKLTRPDNGDTSQITFVVRDDSSTSDIVYQTSDPTWQAYNVWGGNDFYVGTQALSNSQARAFKVSYNRPYATRGSQRGRDFLFANEYPTLRFMERNGYDMSYISGVDTDRAGSLLKNHKAFISVGHDEYWSQAQRANVEAARDAGVSLMFLSGNEVYWRTRYEPSIDGSNTPYRTLTCYKQTWDNAATDPVDPHSTSTFRDPRFATGADGGNPENALTGTAYLANDVDLSLQVSGLEGKLRVWRNTGLGDLADTDATTLAPHTVGYESDEDLDNGFRPAGLIDVSTTVGATSQYLQDFGTVTKPGTTTHHVTMYRAASGALVFGAGTVQWGWGLDSYHDGINPAPADSRMQQATVNVLADMGVAATTLMSALTPAQRSTDTAPPTVTITAPDAGTGLAQGAQVTVSGTAADADGRVGGVEVSLDAGATWHPATGTASWSYTGVVRALADHPVQVRATDDSLNTSAPVLFGAASSCPCTLFGQQAPTTAATVDAGDGGAAELGTRFSVDRPSYVTGVRFYKATANTGTHSGTLWAANGTALASGTFVNETASGWQTLRFSKRIAMNPGTVYTVSYYAPNGHYSLSPNFFVYQDYVSAPLRAGAYSAANANAVAGVFTTKHAFPRQTYKLIPNYWVDPVVVPGVPLDVASVGPRNGATTVPVTVPATMAFTTDVDPASVRVTATTAGGQSIAGSVAYDAPSRQATFTPSGGQWSQSTTYTVTVSALTTDGIAMTAPTSWTFSTVAPDGRCPCTLVDTASSTPTTATAADTRSVELGARFTADTDGTVLGVQFYKGDTTNGGAHVGSLWGPDGTQLASASFDDETTSGWQYAPFSSPVAVSAGQVYTVSYRAPLGGYSLTANALTAGRDNFPLHVPAKGGVYTYGSGVPTTATTTDYGVDLLFSIPASVTPQPAVNTPQASASGVPTGTSVSAMYGTSVTAGSPVLALTDPSGNVIQGQTTLDPTQKIVTFNPTAPLPTSTTFTATLTGGRSLGGVVQPSALSWSFTTASTATVVGRGLFAPTAVPATVDAGDATPTTVGTKFTTSAAGTVAGVRFYKAPANVGTHTVSLWNTASGARLATATSVSETSSGWQSVAFAAPVSLTPNTTYTVSYWAPKGHYSSSSGYFAQPVTRGTLTAPVGAGAYVYRGDNLPTATYQNTNYWVDPLFVEDNPSAPTVTARTPLAGSTSVATSTAVTVTLSADIAASTLQASLTVTTGSGSATAVPVTTAYDDTRRIVTLTPTSPLPRGGTVTVQVSATGANGGAMSSPDTWTFVTAQPSPAAGVCPCALWDDAATPTTITSTDARAVELGLQFKADVAGTVSGVRFYKGPKNTGTHTVYLTTTAGARLATATATSESASGWQTVMFASPVPISAGTVYLVSYHTSVGAYSVSSGAFASVGLDNAPLHVAARGPSRYVYRAAGDTTTPTTVSDANYWVGPVFTRAGAG